MPLRITKRSPLSKALGLDVKAEHKYRAVPTVVDGEKFPSQREANRWCALRLELKVGAIADLRRQITYTLHAPQLRTGELVVIGRYVADFVYRRGTRLVVEDSKGVRTALYRWKKKHVLAEYGIAIEEV